MTSLIRKPEASDPKATIKDFVRATTRSLGKPKKMPSAEDIIKAATHIVETKWDADGEPDEMEIHLAKLVIKGNLQTEMKRIDENRKQKDPDKKFVPLRDQMVKTAMQVGNHFVPRKL